MDIAEIALAETGSHGLSARAVSSKGAMGVWQLMPSRARSHGFDPEDMVNDENVLKQQSVSSLPRYKWQRAISKERKLYCGVGPQANAYEVKRIRFRHEIFQEMMKHQSMTAENDTYLMLRPS
ncbi:MAG: hypothetical protein MZU95_08335 [Desulfomicrobium escambiense]|nr:hypothetical protein [Desulfomicrobium escambiense]